MNDQNIFDKLQTAQNKKSISKINVFDEIINNAWEHGTVDTNSPKDQETQKKRTEKEKLKEKGFGKPEEHPKLIQATINQLEQYQREYERKRKFDYPEAIELYDETIKEKENAIKALDAKQYTEAAEHCKKGTITMSQGKPLFNENMDQLQDIQD